MWIGVSSRDKRGGGDKGFYSQSNDRGAHPIGNSPITPEPGGSARVRKTYSPIRGVLIWTMPSSWLQKGGMSPAEEKHWNFPNKVGKARNINMLRPIAGGGVTITTI